MERKLTTLAVAFALTAIPTLQAQAAGASGC